MHTDSVFDELGLVGKLATRTRTSHREKNNMQQSREKQSMQRIELPKTM
jgi:hypothetical protein